MQEMRILDEQGFRAFLTKRQLPEKTVKAHISIVKEFEKYLRKRNSNNTIDKAKPIDFDDFSEILKKTGKDTSGNIQALARYAIFKNNKTLIVHVLEMTDGASVMENLSRNLRQKVGEDKWKEIFSGIE